MLLDHRTYTVRVGTLKKQLALYEKHGLAVQKRYFGEPLAWLISDTGDVNSYVHIWMYEDAADRNRKRTALFSTTRNGSPTSKRAARPATSPSRRAG
jgi:hypothetical protein